MINYKKILNENLFDKKKYQKRNLMINNKGIVKLESSLLESYLAYCFGNKFQYIISPQMTSTTAICEDPHQVFRLDWWGEETTYLSHTAQLYLEPWINDFEKVFTIGRSFRKEEENPKRHLLEFTLLEFENKNEDLNGLKKEIEKVFDSMLKNVLSLKELKTLNVSPRWVENLLPPYNSISYTDAIPILNKENIDIKYGDDLKSKHEAILINLNNNKPLFVTHFPEEIKYFNMRRNRENKDVVNSLDLIMPFGGEAVGGAEREDNYDLLVKKLKDSYMLKILSDDMRIKKNQKHMTKKEIAFNKYEWYLDWVKDHPILHAGCGIGLNRVVQSILKTPDIRDTTAYPITRTNLF